MTSSVLFEQKNQVGIITLNNPKQLNAITLEMRGELINILQECESSNEINVIILKGQGGNFCSGSNVSGMQKRTVLDTYEHMNEFNKLVVSIHNMDKVVIAMVEGYAAGAGFSLALAADMIFASPNAKFGLAFNKLGLVPDCGLTYFLPRLVGANKAKEWILSAAMISAEEAKENRIVNSIIPAEEIQATVMEKAQTIANGPFYANKLMKSIINNADQMTLEEVLNQEQFAQTILQQTEDHQEGVMAFRNKQKPIFKGK